MQWMYHYINMIPRFQCSTTFHFMTMNLWFLLRLWQAKVIAGITHILSHLRERQGKPAAGAAETRLERACDLLGQDTEQRHKGQIRIDRHNITWHFIHFFTSFLLCVFCWGFGCRCWQQASLQKGFHAGRPSDAKPQNHPHDEAAQCA